MITTGSFPKALQGGTPKRRRKLAVPKPKKLKGLKVPKLNANKLLKGAG